LAPNFVVQNFGVDREEVRYNLQRGTPDDIENLTNTPRYLENGSWCEDISYYHLLVANHAFHWY